MHKTRNLTFIGLLAFLLLYSATSAFAALNTAVNDPAGSFVLQDSVAVDITPTAALQLMKGVYNGATCIAASDSDAACGNVAAANAPSGTELTFVIYIANTSSLTLNDIRVTDTLDAAFTYVPGSLSYGSVTAAASWANAYGAAITSGGSDAAAAGDPVSAAAPIVSVGGDGTALQNDTVNIAPGDLFAIAFNATVN